MRAFMYLSIAVLLFVQLSFAGNPLGNCEGGRAAPYTLAASSGACNLPTLPGIYAANVDDRFFAGGAKCGACYEVSGPLGTRTVQILDRCPADTGTGTCTGETTQFGVDEANVFNQIANRTANTGAGNIFDLGFRPVTCDVIGNVKLSVSGSPSKSYFQLAIYNFRVPLQQVRIRGNKWGDYESLSRQGLSGIWNWNKQKYDLSFPLTFYLVGTTDQLITYEIKSGFKLGEEVDFGAQFAEVDGNDAIKCPLYSSPDAVYADRIGFGWSTDYSYGLSGKVDLRDTTNVYAGTSSIHAAFYQYGGLQFTRDNGYNPLYFSHLTFFIKSAGANVNLKVFLTNDAETGGKEYRFTVTGEWQNVTIPVSELTTSELEQEINFQNLNTEVADLYWDNIQWIKAPITPLDKVPAVTSTTAGITFEDTTGSVVLVDTTGTTGFSFDEPNGPSSSTVAVVVNFFVLFVVSFACLL